LVPIPRTPMKPIAIRLLGAITPAFPNADDETT